MILNSNQLKNRDLLVICPTRQRSEQLARMVKSFNETISSKTSLILAVDLDDTTEYNYNCAISIEPQTTITNRINSIFHAYHNFKYYSITNDDMEYLTPDWDSMMMEKGINCAKDPNRDYPFPVTMVVDGDIPRALGWLQLPTLKHLCNDNVYAEIGRRANCLNYHEAVIIEHHHFLFNKSDKDENYTKSQAVLDEDISSFVKWLAYQSHTDCEKVRKLYEKKT